jgi:hypothetical protein
MRDVCSSINQCLSLLKYSTLLRVEELRLEVRIRQLKFLLQSRPTELQPALEEVAVDVLSSVCNKVSKICSSNYTEEGIL